MSGPKPVKLSIRLSQEAHAGRKGFEIGDHIRQVLARRVAKSGRMKNAVGAHRRVDADGKPRRSDPKLSSAVQSGA